VNVPFAHAQTYISTWLERANGKVGSGTVIKLDQTPTKPDSQSDEDVKLEKPKQEFSLDITSLLHFRRDNPDFSFFVQNFIEPAKPEGADVAGFPPNVNHRYLESEFNKVTLKLLELQDRWALDFKFLVAKENGDEWWDENDRLKVQRWQDLKYWILEIMPEMDWTDFIVEIGVDVEGNEHLIRRRICWADGDGRLDIWDGNCDAQEHYRTGCTCKPRSNQFLYQWHLSRHTNRDDMYEARKI
jgi:hypothetical protein